MAQQQKQIQIQFRLMDVKQLQFVNLANEWPEGEMQINNQLQFNCETDKRIVRCNANFEYKKNDITQLILGVQTVFEFTRDSWSSLYQLNEDQWVLPAGLVQHMADITIGSARGIMAVRSEEAGIPKQILPLVNPGQMLRNNIAFTAAHGRHPRHGIKPGLFPFLLRFCEKRQEKDIIATHNQQ